MKLLEIFYEIVGNFYEIVRNIFSGFLLPIFHPAVADCHPLDPWDSLNLDAKSSSLMKNAWPPPLTEV